MFLRSVLFNLDFGLRRRRSADATARAPRRARDEHGQRHALLDESELLYAAALKLQHDHAASTTARSRLSESVLFIKKQRGTPSHYQCSN